MQSVLEDLVQQESSANTAAIEAYRAIVRQLAAGDEDPELRDVQSALAASGKTTSDLRADVSKRRQRDVLRAKLSASEAANAERASIAATIEAANRELEIARQNYDQVVGPLSYRLDQINQLSFEASCARGTLQRECDDRVILASQVENRRRMDHVEKKIRGAQDVVDRIAANRDAAKERREIQVAAAAQTSLDIATAALADLRAALDRLVEESNDLVQKMIEA